MKKTTLTILCLLMINSLIYAQAYFRTGGGYALPLATQSVGENHLRQDKYVGNTATQTNTSESVSASYGSGINFNIGGGFMFSEYLGAELNVSYLIGKKYEISDIYTYEDDNTKGRDEYIVTMHSNALFITPSFVITSGGKNAPYARFGVVLGSPKLKQEASSYYDLDGTDTQSLNTEYSGGFTRGFQGAAGMNWALGGSLKLYTEITFISMTYYPKKGEVTEYINNGVSNINQLTVFERETDFVKKIDNYLIVDSSKPRQELRHGTPFSSISLQVGIVFFMGEKEM
jgi:hypothetical protein